MLNSRNSRLRNCQTFFPCSSIPITLPSRFPSRHRELTREADALIALTFRAWLTLLLAIWLSGRVLQQGPGSFVLPSIHLLRTAFPRSDRPLTMHSRATDNSTASPSVQPLKIRLKKSKLYHERDID